MRRSWTIAAWAAAAIGLLLAGGGLGSARAARRPSHGGLLRLPTDSPIHSLDPLEVSWPAEALLSSLIYDSPYALSPAGGGGVQPHLLRPLKTVGGRTVRFKVRPHAVFHDGSPVKAEQVVESLRRLASSADHGWLLAMVEGVTPTGGPSAEGLKVVGGATVQIKVSSARDLDLLAAALAAPQAGVTPSARKAGKGVGTGPFVLRPQKGADRELRVNRDYFDGPPYLSEVRLLGPVSREEHIRRFQLEKADASLLGDSVYGEPPPLKGVGLVEGPASQLVYLVFNTAKGPARDLPLRRAVDLALDRRRLAGAAAQPLEAYISSPGAKAVTTRDPERARTLLAGLGFTQASAPLVLLVEDADAFGAFLAPQIQRDLSAVGLPVSQVIATASEAHGRLAAGTWDLRLVTLSPVSADEVLQLGQVLALGGLRAEAFRLVAQASTARQEEVKRAVLALGSQLSVVPLCVRRPRLHHRIDLRGVGYDALGRLLVADLWVRPAPPR